MDIMGVRTEPKDLIGIGRAWNQTRFDEIAKSFLGSILKYIITNGTDDKLLGTNIAINETTLERTIETIFRVHKNLAEVSCKNPFMFLSFLIYYLIIFQSHMRVRCPHPNDIMKNLDPYYMKLSKLQNITDEYVKSKNRSLVTKLKWKPFMEEFFKDVEGFNPEQKFFIGCIDWLKNVSYFMAITDEQDLGKSTKNS